MIKKIKQILYFPIAYYFRFFAAIQPFFWKPKVIVITGSNAKTTLLHFLQSQIGDRAHYSHHANSAYGVPFDILGLNRKTLTIDEWPMLFLLAPFKAFKKKPEQKLYIVEADCDRVNEGKFLASLLKPEVTLWTNSSNSHAQNFPSPAEKNIAYEFGYFIENTTKLCIVNGDSPLIISQLRRANAKIEKTVKKGHLQSYTLQKQRTTFKIDNLTFDFKFLLPEDSFYSIAMTLATLDYLKIQPDIKFSKFSLPLGRSSKFSGIKNITIIDSSYNATPSSMKVILDMFKKYPANKKWLILGDMIELGQDEEKEHQNLAKLIDAEKMEKIILVGPRLSKYTYPKLKSSAQKFERPKEALDYIKKNIKGGEVLLFKGARFLEGMIEHLLKNKSDISKLCRREAVWQKRRQGWEL